MILLTFTWNLLYYTNALTINGSIVVSWEELKNGISFILFDASDSRMASNLIDNKLRSIFGHGPCTIISLPPLATPPPPSNTCY